jgi:beta-lactamase regulating signal transducer with metallopeptidase domain
MNTLALPFLWALLRTGIALSLSAVVVAAFLRVFRVGSPAVRRTAYVAVLLQGWLFFESPFSLPLPTPLRAREEKVVRRKESTQTDRGPARTSSLLSTFYSLTRPASVSGSSSTVDSNERVPMSPTVLAHSTLAIGAKSPSIPSQKSTGGPKLPPVAPEPENAGSVAVSADELPTNQPPFPLALALLGLWGTGIACIAGRSAWAYVKFVRRFAASRETPPDWADEWTSLQLEAGLPGIVPLVVAQHAGPVLCRLTRGYRLIVPAAAWRTLEQSQRLLILRHELAHIERHDVWKSLAMRILALPHWFNPLVWHIVRRFDESAEWACDEAAAGAAPERVPDYARALLQLSHRAQPAFFATSAARTKGLALRIRRLLNPAAINGTKMKTTLMATLLLGISLVNVARLQTRAEGPASPSGVDAQEDASPVSQAATDKPSSTNEDSKRHGRLVTVMVPVTKTIMVPVTTTEMVPKQVFVNENMSDRSQPTTRLVADPQRIVACTQTWAPAGTTSSDTSQGGELQGTGGPTGLPRLARVDLQYVLDRMREYQHEKDGLEAELETWKNSRRVKREEMLRAAQERMNRETNPVIKEILLSGMAEKNKEMSQENNEDITNKSIEIMHRMSGKIAEEVASYAKEHRILVVRRVVRGDYAGSYDPRRNRVAFEHGRAYSKEAFVERKQSDPFQQREPWNDAVMYSAEPGTPNEVNISGDIVNRLNARYAAKQQDPKSKSK